MRRNRKISQHHINPAALVSILAAVLLGFNLVSCQVYNDFRIGLASKPSALVLQDLSLDPVQKALVERSVDVAAFDLNKYGSRAGAGKPSPAAFRYLRDAAGLTAFRVSTIKPNTVLLSAAQYFITASSAQKSVNSIRRQGELAFIERLPAFPVAKTKLAPLTPSLSNLSLDRYVEWLNLQIFKQRFATHTDERVQTSFPAFAAEKATLAYIREKSGSDSTLLGQYLSEKRDERTFAALFPDLYSRIQTLYDQEPLPADLGAQRKFLVDSWLLVYRDQYPNRFITNKYRDFASKGISDEELAVWKNEYTYWSYWEKRLSDKGSDLKALIAELERN
ncbi:hypothetical protein MASR2M78_10300 [Treponema sp.]